MEFTVVVSLLSLMIAGFGISMAARTHQLDWTVNNDFTKWAASSNIQVGDNIYFNYNSQVHSVLQVSSQDYQSCNTKNPIATYNSGIDLVRITAPGDYYYICGHEGHCRTGQQLHVSIGQNPSNPINPTNPSNPTNPIDPSNPTNPSNPMSNSSPPMTYEGVGPCPPLDPSCDPVGDIYQFHNPPGEVYPSSSSSLAAKWLRTFGAWVGIFLASRVCGITLLV